MKKLIIITWVAWIVFTLPVSYAEAPKLTQQQRYENELSSWIERLAWDESHNRENIIILDTDGNLAYSCLQYHYGTFISQSRKFGLSGEIGSCRDQKNLAKAMIRDNWKAWRNWYTSVTTKTAGYPPKLEDM